MNRKLVAAITVAIVAFAGGAIVIRRGRATSIAVAPGPIRETVIAQGKVVAIRGVAEVRALLDGRVIAVTVLDGDHVNEGQLLARLDPAEIDASIAGAEAERDVAEAELRQATAGGRGDERRAASAVLAEAKTALALAETRAARDTALADKGAIPAAEADETRRAAEMARSRVDGAVAEQHSTLRGRTEQIDAAHARFEAANAALVAARARRERTLVVAPSSGIVLARHVDAGDNVLPGAMMFEVADPAAVELRIELEQTDALRVAPGLDVTITAPGAREVLGTGNVVRLAPQLGARTIGASEARLRAETQVRSAWVQFAKLDGPPLPIGLRVEAHVHLAARNVAARVPRDAVRIDDGHARVEIPGYRLTADERAVDLGIADEHWVEVRGVAAGTRVVASEGSTP